MITEELGDKTFPEDIGKVVKRVIHTTADFQFADITIINEGAIDRAKEISESDDSYFMPQQFENKSNPEAHRKTTMMLQTEKGVFTVISSGNAT